jgi:FAD dependent oxidoreductase TIGR03364
MAPTFDDAVVGAGILGLAHAYHLVRRGRRVVVYERNPRACGASVRNFGMLWPIGQPPGPLHDLALRSLAIWREILSASQLWHADCGSLHLAYREDEWRILQEFAAQASSNGYEVSLLTPAEVREKAPLVRREGLQGALFSPVETCIDPRQVIAGLPGWLEQTYGVTCRFGQLVTHIEGSSVRTQGSSSSDVSARERPIGVSTVERVWVCSGEDLQTLYPEKLTSCGLRRCKLQMLRSEPQGDQVRLGPMLAGGLTLRHYLSFAPCPSLPDLQRRIARDAPAYDRYGIHVMASQNGRGEIVIGDSHEYDLQNDEPFDKEEIDDLILSYLRTFLDIPGLRIAQRWHGIYLKHPTSPFLVLHPAEGVIIVNGVGGNGMTLSFGLAEQVVDHVLGAS